MTNDKFKLAYFSDKLGQKTTVSETLISIIIFKIESKDTLVLPFETLACQVKEVKVSFIINNQAISQLESKLHAKGDNTKVEIKTEVEYSVVNNQ